MRTYFVETWGCQMNVLDSQFMEGLLLRQGLTAAPAAEEADVVVLNTCSVREKAVQKVLSRLGELHRIQRESGRPEIVGLCGCIAEQEGENLLKRSRVLSFVLGPGRIAEIPVAIESAMSGKRAVFTGFVENRDYDAQIVARGGACRHYVTAIHGCEQHCTYCVVPYTRGREVSRPMHAIVAEITGLARMGAVEITLLGQTINAYRCPETKADLADLLAAVTKIEGPSWIQFITSHPRFFTEKLVNAIGRLPRLGTYLHLPLQAGSNRILAAMNRRYTRERYLDLVRQIREQRPETVFSTDVIVGFPGESDEDFELTLDMVREVRFGQLFGFIYSPRPRTPAALLERRVERSVAGARLDRLFKLQAEIQLVLQSFLIGSTRQILLDGPSRRGNGQWQGRGGDNRVVNLPGHPGFAAGQLVTVNVTGATPYALLGKAASDRATSFI